MNEKLSPKAERAFAQRVIDSAQYGFNTPGAKDFKGKDIIILAMGPSRGYCLFDTETWAVNLGYYQIAQMHGRIDKLFLAHCQVKSSEGNPIFKWAEMNSLVDRGMEIINTHKVKGLKSKLYPIDTIIKKFRIDYFTDTIAYMIAYALHLYTVKDRKTGLLKLKQPLRLKLYGIDIQDIDEYQFEKPGIEFWLGYAMGLGVEITNAFGSTLFMTVNGLRYGQTIPLATYDPSGLYKKMLRKEKRKHGHLQNGLSS